MEQTKENLINSLVIDLAETSNLPINELKSKIETKLYNWNCTEITNTELSLCDGSVTRELLKYFRIGKLGSNKTIDTIEQYERAALQLCDMVNKELNMITSDDVKYFLVMYKQTHQVSDSTMESKRLYLSSVFTYLFKNKKIPDNPMDRVDPISFTNKVKTPLSEEEIEQIIMSCDRDKRSIAIIYFLLSTGVRVSELCGVKLKDIDFSRKRVLVLGKRSKERFVYMDGKTRVRIMDYIENEREDIKFESGKMIYNLDTPLFASKDNLHHPLKRGCIEKILKDLGSKSGIERLHPHLLRATFATKCIKRGVDINIVAKLLGHSKIETTTKYILLSNDDIENALTE